MKPIACLSLPILRVLPVLCYLSTEVCAVGHWTAAPTPQKLVFDNSDLDHRLGRESARGRPSHRHCVYL